MATAKNSKQGGVAANQITPGTIVQIGKELFQVESSVKVALPKGAPFIKTKLENLDTGKTVEKNFKLDQLLQEVQLESRDLEFLYVEAKDFVFLDIHRLDRISVSEKIVGSSAEFIKEGVQLSASIYGEKVYAVELPQFLELMVASTKDASKNQSGNKTAVLETGAEIEVPPFIESGDIIKVDTRSYEYIQRV